jgi:hypothetical protein
MGGGGNCPNCGNGLVALDGGPTMILNYFPNVNPFNISGKISVSGIGYVTGLEASSSVAIGNGTSIEAKGIGTIAGVVVKASKK